jgi:hypothetical protein
LLTEKPEQVESSEAGTREEPTTHSLEISSSVAASFLPSPQLPVSCDISDTKPSTFWRPWEDLHKDKTVDGDDVISQKSLVTPPKPYFSQHLKTSPRDWSPSSTAIHHHPPQVSRSKRNHHWSLVHWGGHPGSWRLDLSKRLDLGGRISKDDLSSPGISQGHRSDLEDYSNQTSHTYCIHPLPSPPGGHSQVWGLHCNETCM